MKNVAATTAKLTLINSGQGIFRHVLLHTKITMYTPVKAVESAQAGEAHYIILIWASYIINW